MITGAHSILARWRNHFSQLLNVHGFNGIRQTEKRTEEPLVAEPCAFEVEIANEKSKRLKPPGIDQIPTELFKAWGKKKIIALRSINLFILFGIWRNCLRSGRSRSFYLSVRRVVKEIVVIIEAYHICQLRTKFYPTACCQG